MSRHDTSFIEVRHDILFCLELKGFEGFGLVWYVSRPSFMVRAIRTSKHISVLRLSTICLTMPLKRGLLMMYSLVGRSLLLPELFFPGFGSSSLAGSTVSLCGVSFIEMSNHNT
jgi:hypothetical protein